MILFLFQLQTIVLGVCVCVCVMCVCVCVCVCVDNTMIHEPSHNELWQLMTCAWFIINPVPTDFFVFHDSHCCSFIQYGETALDLAKDNDKHEVVQYLKEVGKYNNYKLDLILYITEHCVCIS